MYGHINVKFIKITVAIIKLFCPGAAYEQEHMLLLVSCQQICMTYTIAVCTVNNF